MVDVVVRSLSLKPSRSIVLFISLTFFAGYADMDLDIGAAANFDKDRPKPHNLR